MPNRSFEFESIVIKDENQQLRIDLGSDNSDEMRFTIKFENILHIKSIFIFINYLTTLPLPSYDRHMIPYKDWYANEIIHRITSDTTHFETQSDAKKEVLKELLQRRNKLQNQIKKAMTYYDENKSKIDAMEKIRATYQKVYPGPMMILADDYLIFENITEFGDLYYQLSLQIPQNTDKSELKYGSGWLEFSKTFGDNIIQIKSNKDLDVILTNSKPRSDMRVLRRSDQQASHLLKMSPQYNALLSEIPLYLWMLKTSKVYTFELSKNQIFMIVERLLLQFKDNSPIEVTIKTKVEKFSIKSNPSNLILHLPDKNAKFDEMITSISSSAIFALQNLVYLVEKVKIHVIGPTFGIFFNCYLQNYQLLIYSHTQQQRSIRYLRRVLRNFLLNENKSDQFYDILKGDTNITPDEKFYSRQLGETDTTTENREYEAYDLINFYGYRFSQDHGTIFYSDNLIDAYIKVDKDEGNLEWNCNCQKSHPLYKCEHLLACYFKSFQEGILLA